MKPVKPPRCRFVADDQPRLLRTHLKDCNTSGCDGCTPCEERHCSMPHCTGEHLDPMENQACAKCVGKVRTDLGMIVGLCQSETIVEELLERGPRSNAAWVLAPAADVDTWYARDALMWEAAILGDKGAKGWLEDNRHESHPMWVLGYWDLLLRHYYGLATIERATIPTAAAFIGQYLTDAARDPGIDFSVLANALHECRTMLEHVLPIDRGLPQRGAECPTCGKRLEKVYDVEDITGKGDRWHCEPCQTWRTQKEYDQFVDAVFLANADRLTASQIKAQYGVPEGTVYRWGLPATDTDGNETAPPRIRKRGRNDQGLQLYDVADVKAQIDRRNTTKESA